jgi:holliday junction DNA helicase RuvA
VEDRSAPAPVTDAISALVNLGYPQVQASAAVAAAMKQAGDEAEAKTLIRLGLRELAR